MELLILLTLFLNICADQLDRSALTGGDPIAVATWSAIAQLLLILPLIGLVTAPDLKLGFFAMIAGCISAAGRLFWYRALSKQGVTLTNLAPFNQLSHVFILLLALVVFDETPGITKLIGAFLIVASAILMQIGNTREQLGRVLLPSFATLAVLVFAFSTATTSIYYKALLVDGVDVLSIYFFLKLFQLLSLAMVTRYDQLIEVGGTAIRSPQRFAGARMLQTIAALIYVFVLSAAELTAVQPVAALGPFMVFAWEQLAVKRSPSSMHLQPGRSQLFAFVVLTLGLYLFVSG